MTDGEELKELNIELIDQFDSDWPKRIIELNGYRMQSGIPLADQAWLTICDIADELLSEAALLPEHLANPTYEAATEEKIRTIFGLFKEDLASAKEKFMRHPSLLNPPR